MMATSSATLSASMSNPGSAVAHAGAIVPSTQQVASTATAIAAHVLVHVLCVLRQPASFLYSSCTLNSVTDRA